MPLCRIKTQLETLSSKLDTWFARTGAVALLLTMTAAVANMILRPVGHPLTGSFELMGLGCAVTTALGLALAQEHKNHIAVDILYNMLPVKIRMIAGLAGNLACCALFSAASLRLVQTGLAQMKTGEVSETLRMPFYPVIWIVAAGFALLTLRLLTEALKSVTANHEKGEQKR